MLVKSNLILNIPPFKGNRTLLSPEDVVKTRKLAAVRIHVERAIGQVMTKFRLFDRHTAVHVRLDESGVYCLLPSDQLSWSSYCRAE